jgi:hypothetical protein
MMRFSFWSTRAVAFMLVVSAVFLLWRPPWGEQIASVMPVPELLDSNAQQISSSSSIPAVAAPNATSMHPLIVAPFARAMLRPIQPPIPRIVSARQSAPLGCSPLLFVPLPIKYDFCVIPRVKNSAEWLPEWIEYHKLLGAERFFIADDCSDDNGETVKVLEYYSSLGFVEHYTNVSVHPCDVPGRSRREELLISYVFKKAKEAQCDWVTMLDIDEYITILDGFEHKGGIRRIFQASLLPYLKLGWWTAGSDGHELKPNKLTMESYRRGIFEDYHTKVIARPLPWRSGRCRCSPPNWPIISNACWDPFID